VSANGGLLASGRRLLATLLELAQVRLQLAATELELEKLRLFDALLLAAAALTVLGVGIVLLCVLAVVLAGEAWRVHVLLTLTVLFVGGGVAGLLWARSRLRRPGSLLQATAAEFARDRADLLAEDSAGRR
jgi:uncharacterized membrane protein YqjE